MWPRNPCVCHRKKKESVQGLPCTKFVTTDYKWRNIGDRRSQW